MSSRDSGSRWFRRGLASVLAVMFFAVFMFGSVKEAEAATQYKTYYVPTKITESYSSNSGGTDTTTRKFTYYTGSRAGLLKQEVYTNSGRKLVISRNGSGLMTNYKVYYGDELENWAKTTINKGLVKRVRLYDSYSGDQASMVYSLAYKSGRISKITLKDGDVSGTIAYRSNGKYSKYSIKYEYGSQTLTFNSKGYPVKAVMTSTGGPSPTKQTVTLQYTYNKKGLPTKIIENIKGTNPSTGETETQKVTITLKYTFKNGNLTKCVQKMTGKTPYGDSINQQTTYTCTYKKVKVKKKFWDMMDGKVPYAPCMYNSVKDMTDFFMGNMFRL